MLLHFHLHKQFAPHLEGDITYIQWNSGLAENVLISKVFLFQW